MENPGWKFRARTRDGEIRTGEVQAASPEEARRVLVQRGLIPDDVRPAPKDQPFRLRRRPGSKALAVFTRQFATLVESAIPLVMALDILESITDDAPLREATGRITRALQAGATLADAMRNHPTVFNPIYVYLVEAGEESGTLDVTLKRLASYLEKSQELRERVRSALIYPALIVVVAMFSVVAMLTLVVPAFEEMFAASGVSLPFATQVVVETSRFVGENWRPVALALLLLGLAIEQIRDSDRGRVLLDGALLATPVIGSLVRKAAIARFTRTAASLLASGINILDTISVAARTSGNVIVERAIMRTHGSIAAGQGVAGPLAQTRILPKLLAQMVKVGEETGRLDQMFEKVAEFYEQEVESSVEGLMKSLEPAMVVVVGAILGGMVVAMYLPVFEAIALPG